MGFDLGLNEKSSKNDFKFISRKTDSWKSWRTVLT